MRSSSDWSGSLIHSLSCSKSYTGYSTIVVLAPEFPEHEVDFVFQVFEVELADQVAQFANSQFVIVFYVHFFDHHVDLVVVEAVDLDLHL